MTDAQILVDANILWQYHLKNDVIPSLNKSLIIGLGSYDIRVAQHCAKLFFSGNDNIILFTGKTGNWTNGLWETDSTEAEIFASIAKNYGVPGDKILLEQQATNLGENIKFSKVIIEQQAIHADRLVIVTKPNTTRRAYATFLASWPVMADKLLIATFSGK